MTYTVETYCIKSLFIVKIIIFINNNTINNTVKYCCADK
jgi:hypothetical protein